MIISKRTFLLYLSSTVLFFVNPLLGGEIKKVRDVFENTQAVIYSIWFCKPNQELAALQGSLAELNILALERPSPFDSQTFERAYQKPPSFPFGFNDLQIPSIVDSMRNNDTIIDTTILRGENDWGQFISFRIKAFPQYDIQRYPAFLVVILERLRSPLLNKEEYQAQISKLVRFTTSHFAQENVLSALLGTISEPWGTRKHPLLLVTHINDSEKIGYLTHMSPGLKVTENWTADELVSMGVLPHNDFEYHMFSGRVFIASPTFSQIQVITIGNKPPFTKEMQQKWRLQNPLSGELERILRWSVFCHALLPYVVNMAETFQTSQQESLLIRLSDLDSEEDLNNVVSDFTRRQKDFNKTLWNIRKSSQHINRLMGVLNDVLVMNKATFSDNFWKTGLHSSFIREGLRYDLTYNYLDHKQLLSNYGKTLEKRASEIATRLDNISFQFNQKLSLATTLFAIKQSWLMMLLGLLLGGFGITLFQKDISKLRLILGQRVTKLFKKSKEVKGGSSLNSGEKASRVFEELFLKVFEVNFESYLESKGTKLCFLRSFRHPRTNSRDCEGLFGDFNDEIIVAVKEKGLFKCKAGYYPYHHQQVKFPDPTDIVFVSDEVLTDDKLLLGILYHEVCHALLEHKIDHGIAMDKNDTVQGKQIRKYTKYQFEDGIGHTDRWFSLLYAGSFKMARCYSDYFEGSRNVVETALEFDWEKEPMEAVTWRK